jgi:hypothetical protein
VAFAGDQKIHGLVLTVTLCLLLSKDQVQVHLEFPVESGCWFLCDVQE